MKMRKITFDEYLDFVSKKEEIVVEDSIIKLKPIKVERLNPLPEELTDISTTVWSFPKRGSWATHKGDYRGNWPPQIPRALMLMYTKPGDTILDPMVGSGTTCIEAKLLGRHCIGVDINYNAVILTLHRLYYLEEALKKYEQSSLFRFLNITNAVNDISIDDILKAKVEIYHGDARNLSEINDESIDLVATHPPYYNIIRYGKKESCIDGDLSKARSLEEYLRWLKTIAHEIYRVLKPGKYLGILIGDTRIHKHYVPISHYVLQVFLETGFILKEEVVKIQHKMKTTREKWSKLSQRDFLLIYHEKLFILRKPTNPREREKYKYSSKPAFIKVTL